jgi:hypothetical protein
LRLSKLGVRARREMKARLPAQLTSSSLFGIMRGIQQHHLTSMTRGTLMKSFACEQMPCDGSNIVSYATTALAPLTRQCLPKRG